MPSKDVVVRFIGDTGNLAKSTDQVTGRLRGVATSLQGIASLGAVVGAVSFFGDAISEARDAERIGRQTEAVLRSTGGAANLTAKQIGDLAGKLSEKTAVDDEVIQHGENVLLTFKQIRNEAGKGNDIFSQTTEVALDMSAALSQNGDASEGLQGNMVRLGKALNDPIAGISALTKVGVTFSEKQKATIARLVEQGDILGAQKIILSELKSEFGGMAEASADSIGKAQVSWGNFAEEVGSKVMPAFHAVSNWALTTGIPTLGHVAGVVGDVVTPAFHAATVAGGGLVSMWQSLPGPIQAGAIAMGVWALAGDKVTGFLSRSAGPLKNLRDEMQLQRGLASLSGQEISRFGASFAVLERNVPAVGRMGEAFRTARGDVGGFGATAKGVAMAGVTGLKSAATGLMGVLGGPWGIAIAGATVLLTAFAARSAATAALQEKTAAAGKQVADVIAEQNGVINQSVRAAAAKQAADNGLLDMAEQLGISGSQVTSALLGQGTAYEDLTNKLRAKTSADENGLNTEGRMLASLQGLHGEIQTGTQRTKQATEATKEHSGAMVGAVPINDLYKQAIESTGAEFDEAAGAGKQLADAIKGITDEQTSSIETEEAYQSSVRALTESIRQNGHTLDIHTEKGQNNRDMLEDVASKIRDKTLADIQSGVPMNQALARHNARIAALRQEAIKTFGAKSEAVKLINTYGDIPKNIKTKLQQVGYAEINRQMLDLSAKQTALAHGVQIGSPGYQTYVRAINKEKGFQRSATGGPIVGPGGPTADMVPVMASAGEFMQRASAVDYYGVPFMHAINQKRFPKELAQHLAGGGMVWPFPVNLKKTKVPEFAPAFVGGGAAVAGSAGVVAAVRAAASRYGWGSGAQWNALSRLITGESGWNPNAQNPTSTAYGLFQFLNSTWAGTGFAKSSNPAVQAAAGMVYIRSRYGSPAAAYGAWSSRSPHWYDDGGSLRPGVSTVINGTGRTEQVLTPREREAYISQAKAAASGSNKTEVHKHYHFTAHVANHPVDVRQQFAWMEAMAGPL